MLAKKENVVSLEESLDYMNYKVNQICNRQCTHIDWFLQRGSSRYGSHQRVARTRPPRERGGHPPGPHERGCIHKAPKGEGHPRGAHGKGEISHAAPRGGENSRGPTGRGGYPRGPPHAAPPRALPGARRPRPAAFRQHGGRAAADAPDAGP